MYALPQDRQPTDASLQPYDFLILSLRSRLLEHSGFSLDEFLHQPRGFCVFDTILTVDFRQSTMADMNSALMRALNFRKNLRLYTIVDLIAEVFDFQ